MFNGKGYNLSDIAAVTRGNNGDGMFGGDNGWWIILLFLFAGWGGRGFGGGFGGGYEGIPATQADVRAAVDQQTLISKLDNQTYGLADSTYALNNAITNGFHGVDNALCTIGYQNQAGLNALAHQLSDCCCENGRAMERGFADLGYAMATQTNAIQQSLCTSTRDIIDANNAGVRSILDFLVNDKIASLQAENQGLKLAASQAAQNAYLVSELRPCPIPAYTVPNPYCCNTYFGNVGGCGNGGFIG